MCTALVLRLRILTRQKLAEPPVHSRLGASDTSVALLDGKESVGATAADSATTVKTAATLGLEVARLLHVGSGHAITCHRYDPPGCRTPAGTSKLRCAPCKAAEVNVALVAMLRRLTFQNVAKPPTQDSVGVGVSIVCVAKGLTRSGATTLTTGAGSGITAAAWPTTNPRVFEIDFLGLLLSTTVIVTLNVLAAAGVPESAPDEASAIPGGRPEADHA